MSPTPPPIMLSILCSGLWKQMEIQYWTAGLIHWLLIALWTRGEDFIPELTHQNTDFCNIPSPLWDTECTMLTCAHGAQTAEHGMSWNPNLEALVLSCVCVWVLLMLIAADMWEESQRSHPSFLSVVGGQMLPQPWQTLSLLYSAFQSSRGLPSLISTINSLPLFFWLRRLWGYVCVCVGFYFVCIFIHTPSQTLNCSSHLTALDDYSHLFWDVTYCTGMCSMSLVIKQQCWEKQPVRCFQNLLSWIRMHLFRSPPNNIILLCWAEP